MIDLSAVNVLAELERIGWTFNFANEEEIRCCCPFHEDAHPSCNINVAKRRFKCHAAECEQQGDFVTFLARALKSTRRVVLEDLATRYDMADLSKVVNPTSVERWHSALWKATLLLKALYDRGVTDELIRQYRLGCHNKRIAIPIVDAAGHVVNVRQYLPGAPGPQKMRNMRGHGQKRLFPLEQLHYDEIVVCGGEVKAIVVAHLLNDHGVGAITVTAGEGSWDPEFSKHFKGKRVYVCFDIDAGGREGAARVCARVRTDAAWVGDVRLPLNIDKHPHGDVNDWIAEEKATAKDFLALLKQTDEWAPAAIMIYDVSETPTSVHLSEAARAQYTGTRLKVNAVVSAMDTAPYVIPQRVRCRCDRNQEGCVHCAIFSIELESDGTCAVDLSPESPGLLEMIAAPKSAQHDALVTALHVPFCKSVTFQPIEYFNAEDVRLAPQLEISSRAADHVVQPAVCVGHGLELNESYEFSGRMFPHPKTQQSVLLISQARATQDALTGYAPTDKDLRPLRIFQPSEWTVKGLDAQLTKIYTDFETNVTRIFLRFDLHLIVDLAWHSVLLLDFDDRTQRGWTQVLVLGDSAQGKSQTAMELMRHYGLGVKMECKNASVAGLLGGLQQLGTRWFVSWGVIPTHDRRLVVLEELKGAHVDVIAKLTDMRSSGVAELEKIEKRRTHARTRIVALSNPRSDQPLATYSFGVEAIKELVGGLEDVRRFDAVLLVSMTDIDPRELSKLQRDRPKVPHVFTATLCRQCVLWAWTRGPAQITFASATKRAVLDAAVALCDTFTETIPLVDSGSMRYKLARLATALACRTFSHPKGDLQTVLVRRCHVDYVAALLRRIYSAPVFGYLDFSRAVQSSLTLVQPDEIRKRITQVPFPKDFIEQLLHTNEIELRDICDWCGWDRGDGINLLSFLVRKHAFRRDGRAYRKNPPFIALLKEMADIVDTFDRPAHIKEEF